jgi:hypothetical protein
MIGMVGAKAAVDPGGTLSAPRRLISSAARNSTTCQDVAAGKPLAGIAGLSYRLPDGTIEHNPARPMIENMDELPFVAPVYKRDLKIQNYFIGYLMHPYVSIYTGRGCRSLHVLPVAADGGGHRYRTRSAQSVIDEVKWIKENMPEVREIMFDDDTFTDFKPRVEEIARGLGEIGLPWSCNAKANVPYNTLKIMKENGLRLLLVGYESGDDQICSTSRKGCAPTSRAASPRIAASSASRSTARSSWACPARRATRSRRRSSTPRKSIRTRSVSLAAPYPAPRSTSRPWTTAGWRRTRSSTWSTTAACNWPRSAIRT